MEANSFVSKMKADGSAKDVCDLNQAFKEYKAISVNLSTKDRGPFALNLLCILCRNLDKVPSWHAQIENKALLTLSIDCVRETRCLEKPEQVKTLACIYHIHKHVVRQNAVVPPELILKISYMPFENDNMLVEYCKTYWNILADRLTYIERLKTSKMAIGKLLTKLTEDIQKVITMYDTVQFCMNILVFLVKKLHFLYNDINFNELTKVFERIFESLSKKNDLKLFKKLTDKESLELYIKFNDCLYVITENLSKISFKNSILNNVVRFIISCLGHNPDIFHCLQTFYLNSFCCILNNEVNLTYNETILQSLIQSCETAEKMGYKKTMNVTYPFLNQFLRLYIEYFVANCEKLNWNNYFSNEIQQSCLNLMLYFMGKLESCNQLLKCENCSIKSGLHDGLRLSFLVKHFISISLKQNVVISNYLPTYFKVVNGQYNVLLRLCSKGCTNYEKCYKKLQADIHNTAILLNKSQHYDFSIKLFDIYLRNEIKHFKNEIDLKNISRALYNKSICELDYNFHERALKNAYLSLVFSHPDGLKTDKYMSLVMDIKAKALKLKNEDDIEEDESQDDLQLVTVLDACMMSVEENLYGNLKPFFCNLKFSHLLKHEFSMYVKLWPSIVPIAGVWRSLYELTLKKLPWLTAKDDEALRILYEVILETPTAVRSIHSEYYSKLVAQLLEDFEIVPADTMQLRVVYATLLFLKAEYDLAEASQKYEWKITEPNLDPDLLPCNRTAPQEHAAAKCAILAVHMWMDISKELDSVPRTVSVGHALQVAQVFVPQLLHLHRTTYALQLAHTCCQIAQHVDDKAAYLRNAGVLLYHSLGPSKDLECIMKQASGWWSELTSTRDTLDTALVFLCDTAIYHIRCGLVGAAARILRLAQAHILAAYEKYSDINLDLSVGRLMEAQTLLCKDCGPSTLSAVNGTQRHYLTVSNAATKWCSRRLLAATLKQQLCECGARAALVCRALLTWRRGRAAAGAALPSAGAVGRARLYAAIINTHLMDDAQTKIDNRLKHILGFQPSVEAQTRLQIESKTAPFTPKQDIETMLENMTFKKTQTSPSMPCLSVPCFKIPEFLKHENCQCYACDIPDLSILTCQMSGLEASVYFRAKEMDIARNYFDGALKCFGLVEARLRCRFRDCRRKFEDYIVEIVERNYEKEFKRVQLEFLVELSFFELAQSNFKDADANIVNINEIVQEMGDIDPYLRNEVMNLMIASAHLKKNTKKLEQVGLEAEFEALKLSPVKVIEPPKTPEAKPDKPPKLPKMVVKDEEVPNTKRRVIKLNLEDGNSDEKQTTKKTSKRTVFKIPVPVTSKPVLEVITPRPTRSRPDILVTQPSVESSIFDFATPKPEKQKTEFFTPLETPSEQFFTPMTSIKTYSKKSLRLGIVKNLENEFSTPKINKENTIAENVDVKTNMKHDNKDVEKDIPKRNKTKIYTKIDCVNNLENKVLTANNLKLKQSLIENTEDIQKVNETQANKGVELKKSRSKVETGSVKTLNDKRRLRRAVSPGKLPKEEKPERSRRQVKPIRFSTDDN